MKIKFLGVGSASTTAEYYHSNMLIIARSGKRLLLDCGGDVRFSLSESGLAAEYPGREIDAVYISHLHSDHIGGMEWLAFSTYFSPDRLRPKLFMEESLMHELWDCSLKGGLGCIEGKDMHLTDYFICRPTSQSGSFQWEDIRFTLFEMLHVTSGYKKHNSFGLLMEQEAGGMTAFITTDCRMQADLLLEISKRADVIFHDCETKPLRTRVHAHYIDLLSLPSDLRRKMWLYHYQPDPEYDARSDGFLGFVIKGQEFDL